MKWRRKLSSAVFVHVGRTTATMCPRGIVIRELVKPRTIISFAISANERRVCCARSIGGCIDTNDGGKLLEIVAGRQETPFRVRQRGRFDCGRIGRAG
jgi:hypothetical protein